MVTSIECYYLHSSETFHAFHRMFYHMPQIIFESSLDFSRAFPRMFGDIPRNIWRYSPECLATFPGMFGDIPRNVWGHSPEYMATFPGMFGDILRNFWWHSPEYNILPIPRVPRIPFPVPVFLVLYIAPKSSHIKSIKNIFRSSCTSLHGFCTKYTHPV